jgi:RNA polymerase sigma-70 factor (ECF subfamily)
MVGSGIQAGFSLEKMVNASSDRETRWTILLLAAQQADEDAYRRLLEELKTYLRPLLNQKLRGSHHVDDVTQEILIGVHRARHTFDGTRPFMPWFHAIVRYKLIDTFRQNRRLQDHEIIDTDAIEQYSETFGGEPTKEGLDEAVLEALSRLPPKQRRAVELLKMEGKSVKEAAVEMKMSESAVKVSAHRAYEALRKRFLGDKK